MRKELAIGFALFSGVNNPSKPVKNQFGLKGGEITDRRIENGQEFF